MQYRVGKNPKSRNGFKKGHKVYGGFKNNHPNLNKGGYKLSLEARFKISKSKKGKKLSEEHRKQLSISRRKRPLFSIETKLKMSKTHKLRGTGKWNLGRKLSQKTKDKLSLINKGKKFSLERRENISKSLIGKTWAILGRKMSEETRIKISNTMKRIMTKEEIRKRLVRRPMSGLEIKVQTVINKYNLPYKFVGNGEFFIERKNPDFININGEKKAVEVYWKAHKEKLRHVTIDEWMKERESIFLKYGWKLIFIEGSRLNEEKIINYLK